MITEFSVDKNDIDFENFEVCSLLYPGYGCNEKDVGKHTEMCEPLNKIWPANK